jgi:hypothetical protein
MSRSLRVVLVIVAVALFLCCVAGLGATLLGTRLAGRILITNPERVQAVGRQIADYEVPPGYTEMYAMNVLGLKVVAIGPATSSDLTLIMLMQLPAGIQVSQEEMERQVEQALARQTGLDNADMTSLKREETTIKGELATLTVREGTTQRGERLRQVTGFFQGKEGPAVLMVTGEAASWDETTVDGFIASIR